MIFPNERDPFWHFADLLPGSWSPHAFFETYHPESTVLIEESNGFALMDRPWIYFDGWSPKALPWELNAVSFNSLLNPGAPIAFMPMATRSAYLPSGPTPGQLGSGVTIAPHFRGPASSITLSTVSPNLGSYSPWAQFLISTPAIERDQLLYETRRRFKRHYLLDGQWSQNWGDGHNLNLALTHNVSSRRFNDWRKRDTQFIEDADMTTVYAQYQYKTDIRSSRIWLLVNRQERDHLGAELGVLPFETSGLTRFSWTGGLVINRWDWQLSLSLGNERERSQTNSFNFSKELLDNDGDMILSQHPFGTRSSLSLNGRFQPDPEKKRIMRPYLDWQISSLNVREEIHEFNPLTLDGQAYGVILWDKQAPAQRQNQLYKARAGLMLELPVLKTVTLAARGEIGINGFLGKNLSQNASFWGIGLHAALTWRWNERSELSFTASRYTHPLSSELLEFLDNEAHCGGWYSWADLNGDLEFDSSEVGSLLRRTGGLGHRLSDSFKPPTVDQIRLYLSLPMSTHWRFELRGTGKEIRDSWTVRYAEEYGSWQEIDGQRIYLLNRPPEAYLLTNLEADRQKPQYWQLMFRFIGEKTEKWFFSFSFMAHMGLGETPFGNGPGSNDYLAVSETSADPNSWINNYGRLDGDRAFVAKLAYAIFLTKRLSFGLSAKYRDGNPFAILSARMIEDQLIMQHDTLKGEDQYGNKLGPREDYVSEVNLRFSYRIPIFGGLGSISLEWHNLIDVGYELSEYVFTHIGRPPMELTIPRSIRLSFSWLGR